MRLSVLGWGLLLIAGAVIATAPATLVEELLPDRMPVRLAACSGSFWSGSCRAFLQTGGDWSPAGIIGFEWSISATDGVHVRLAQDDRTAGIVQLSPLRWQARDLAFSTPAWLFGLSAPGATGLWHPMGRQTLEMPAFECEWAGQSCVGRGRVAVRDLSFAASGSSPVGSYALDFDLGKGEKLSGRLATLDGLLKVSGTLERSPGKRTRLAGRATADTGTPDAVRRLLEQVAVSEGPNVFRFDFAW